MSGFVLIDMGWKAAKNQLNALNNKDVEVGFLDNNKNIATIAMFNEFGHRARDGSKVPERSFIRSTLKKKSTTYRNETIKRIQLLIKGSLSQDSFLNSQGEFWQKQFKYAIYEFSNPRNKPSTIRQKGFDNPLIHTGLMLAMVKFKVKT